MKLCEGLLSKLNCEEAEDTYSDEFLTGKIKEKLKELNLLSSIKNFPKVIKTGEKNVKLGTVNINLKNTEGLFVVFLSMEVEIIAYVNILSGFAGIVLDWSWKHIRGSNGYRLYLTYEASSNSWDTR